MSRFVAILAGLLTVTYLIGCLVALEVRNNKVPGGVLQQYYNEYADGGSMKWRFGREPDPRKPLHDFITSLGLLVYPVSLGGLIWFGTRLFRKIQLPFSLFVVCVCAVTLGRFIMLGVFTAALG